MKKIKSHHRPYTSLFNDTCDSPAWRALSHGARVLYAALKREHNHTIGARKNGRIFLSLRNAEERVGSSRGQIARWYRELQHYGFIVVATPWCLGLEGKGKATRWRLTELPTEVDPMPSRDFLRWDGTIFQDCKNQNPGPETGTTVVPKPGPLPVPKPVPPKARSGTETGTKANGPSGPETGTKVTLTIPTPPVVGRDATGLDRLRERVEVEEEVEDTDEAITQRSNQ